MIRHKRDDDFLLITQHDHARLSGWFAERLGNADFDPPDPRDETIRGISLHDSGWPLHDDDPTINDNGLPLHVLEISMPLATRLWNESTRLAAEVGPWEGLLASLHVFNLSAIAQKHDNTPHERYENRQDLFLLNRFQQGQIELQEQLRQTIDMRTDIPLRMGLAKPGTDEIEDRLRFNFRLLQAMDRISLDLGCSEPLFESLEPIHRAVGSAATSIRVEHRGAGHMALDPWPFASDRLETSISCKRVPSTPFPDDAAFRRAYAAAPVEPFAVTVEPA